MFNPTPGRIALRRLDPTPDPRALAAQFVMPTDNKEKSTRCEVVAVPHNMHLSDFGIAVPSPAEVGDHVLIGKYSGIEEKVVNDAGEQEEWMFVRYEEILAVERKGKHQYIDCGYQEQQATNDSPSTTDTNAAKEIN